jgi:NAD(P)-dependent dehydrogenase (short-subunit alcohol dehydrogenase family)
MSRGFGIITDAAGGVGTACAERSAAEGWSLILVDVNDKVRKTAPSSNLWLVRRDRTSLRSSRWEKPNKPVLSH